ncbi:MAG: hypothetical protein JXR48_09165 [Candidatus Delongbacteria bacterium]|nr:hypothetical protein [Candidatus Delongbacteria bacterium]
MIDGSETNDGAFTWTNIPYEIEVGTSYKIRVTSLTDGSIFDSSDDFIFFQEKINLVFPNSSEHFYEGYTYNLNWKENIKEKIKIDLLKDNSYLLTISDSTSSSGTSTFAWKVPGLNLTDGYKIKISKNTDEQFSDTSEASFSINNPYLKLTSLNNGEILEPGTSFNITWEDSLEENIKIGLYNNGVIKQWISSDTASDGEFLWSIPWSVEGGSDFKIRIMSTYNSLNYDESDMSFTITPQIQLVFPNGGEKLWVTSTYSIVWNENTVDYVKIELFKSDTLFSIIDSHESSTGTYEWELSKSYVGGSDFKIKIIDAYDESILGESENYFSISYFPKTFGGTSSDLGKSFQQTSDGGFIIAAQTLSFSSSSDFWLIKTDSNGNKEWDKAFGGTDSEIPYYVEQTSDGGYIVTGFTSSFGAGGYDVWLIKVDSNGNEEWNKTFGSTGYEEGKFVHQTLDNGYLIIGQTTSFGAGGYDAWLIKTDSNGNEEWNKTFGGIESDVVYSANNTDDGGFIITGQSDSYGEADLWLLKINSSYNAELNTTLDLNRGYLYSAQQTLDDGYILTGMYGYPTYNAFLIKTNSNGDVIWNKSFGSSEDDCGYSVFQTQNGGYAITGYISSDTSRQNACLIKTDANGNSEWTRSFGGWNDDYGTSIIQSSDGSYIIVGTTATFGEGGWDVWLIKTDSNGNIVE